MATKIAVATLAAAGTTEVDLGVSWSRSRFRLEAIHADGTPAPVRGHASATSPSPGLVTDQILAATGKETIDGALYGGRYLELYGLSDGTLVSVARLGLGEV